MFSFSQNIKEDTVTDNNRKDFQFCYIGLVKCSIV